MNDTMIAGVTARCLIDIRRGFVTSAGVLADMLDESGSPLARRFRAAYRKWARGITYGQTHDFSRSRRWTRWESDAAWHRWLRRRTAEIFGRKWAPWPNKKLRHLYEINRSM